MKKLTIEQKAKAYDEAIKRAEAVIKVAQNQKEVYGCVTTILPELKESEDEKIRKGIIDFIKHESDIYGIKTWCHDYTTEEIIAWLEKQGKKPTTIDIDKMVLEYSQTKNSDFGLPINCMIEAYRKGINDVLHSHILDPNKVIEWLRKNTCAACWDNPDEGVSQRIEQFKKDFEI